MHDRHSEDMMHHDPDEGTLFRARPSDKMRFEIAVHEAERVYVTAPDESHVAVTKIEARRWHKNRCKDGKRPSWELYNGHILFIGKTG